MAAIDEGPSESLIVIDFSVVHDPDRAVLVVDRLVPSFDIDDRKTAHAENHVLVFEQPLIIGAAMHDRVSHATDVVSIVATASVCLNDADYAAHERGFKADSGQCVDRAC